MASSPLSWRTCLADGIDIIFFKLNNYNMSNFLDRLKIERDELKEKIDKLGEFIDNNPEFDTISEMQRVLLVTQSNVMKIYLYTLDERIYDLIKS